LFRGFCPYGLAAYPTGLVVARFFSLRSKTVATSGCARFYAATATRRPDFASTCGLGRGSIRMKLNPDFNRSIYNTDGKNGNFMSAWSTGDFAGGDSHSCDLLKYSQ